ncbi:MAG: spore germination protein [Bacillota bacterium]
MNPFRLLTKLVRPRPSPSKTQPSNPPENDLSKDLQHNVAAIRKALRDPADLYVRDLILGDNDRNRIAVLYLRTMVDLVAIRESVIDALMARDPPRYAGLEGEALLERLHMTLPTVRGVEPVTSLSSAVTAILAGKGILLLDGVAKGLTLGAQKSLSRPFQSPTSELTVMGPQVGLTESIEESIGLIRTRLRTPDLAVERFVIGRKSKTEVRMLYVKGIAPEEIVAELRRRLKAIDTDVVLDTGTIRALIEERPYSPFILERLTERPDTVASELNHGLTAVLVDGSPFALLQPSQFFTVFEASEDYYTNAWAASMLRLIRITAYIMSTIATPTYVAVVTFHHELVPIPLLLNIASSQEGVPFPLALTALLAEIVLDVVREAGVRLPQQFGPAVSIVGALVLGQSAIQAGFVPPGLIIVVMFATIASFAIPRAEKAIAYRLVRFPLLLAASALGFPGLMLASLAVVYHLASLKSLGVPYFSLFTPGNVQRIMKKIVVAPVEIQPKTRPFGHRDTVSQGPLPEPRDPKKAPRRGDRL